MKLYSVCLCVGAKELTGKKREKKREKESKHEKHFKWKENKTKKGTKERIWRKKQRKRL